jgi:hypothetical protein
MLYVAFMAMALGGLLLFGGLLATVSSVFESLRTRQTAVLSVIPCADAALGPHGTGTRVAVRGRTAAAGQGLLRAPLSGEPCVWWRVQVHRIERAPHRNEYEHRVTTRRVPVLMTAATVPFLVTDPSGSVWVDGAVAEGEKDGDEWLSGPLLEVTTQRRSPGRTVVGLEALVETGAIDPRRLRPTKGTYYFEVHETVLRAGVHATVVAHATRRDGVVVLARRKARLTFARPEPLDEIVSKTEADRQGAVAAMLFLLISGAVLTALGVGGALLIGPPG